MIKKLLLVLLLASSFSIAADTTKENADKAFRELDNEFGEGGGNPNDPSVKKDKYKESRDVKQDRYAPRDDSRRVREEPRYNDKYVPAKNDGTKYFYQYVGYGVATGTGTENFSDSTGELPYDIYYETSQFRYGVFMPKAGMKLEVSVGLSAHTDDTTWYADLAEVNYDLMFGKASMNKLFGSFAYVKLGLVVQSYDAKWLVDFLGSDHDSDVNMAGFRLGVGYSIFISQFLEAYVDYSIMSTQGVMTGYSWLDIDVAFSYATLGYGLNILF